MVLTYFSDLVEDFREKRASISYSHASFGTLEYEMDMNFDKIDYYRKNSLDALFKRSDKKTKKRIRLFSLGLRIALTLCPLLAGGDGQEIPIYFFSIITSIVFMAKFIKILNIKGSRYFAYPDTCIEFLSLVGIILTSAATLFFNS
jgi:4-hydroxybenzoate polyprenyltransferase